ncbi:hypothetical protein FCM35_KLT19895 [Carex littledalei]|uniref:Uncharacterized protein n=1 Tax=Carex littledalei TaxID=544730 RepID=A0A833R9D2_9POAL|nr:hypothetical protein FCM35_KLT19895 [Carex littledalei]
MTGDSEKVGLLPEQRDGKTIGWQQGKSGGSEPVMRRVQRSAKMGKKNWPKKVCLSRNTLHATPKSLFRSPINNLHFCGFASLPLRNRIGIKSEEAASHKQTTRKNRRNSEGEFKRFFRTKRSQLYNLSSSQIEEELMLLPEKKKV